MINSFPYRRRIVTSMTMLMLSLSAIGFVKADLLLYSEDFTGTNGASFNGNTTPTSPFGIPALEAYGSSINARINVNRLQMDDGGPNSEGLSFGGTSGRFNWATSSFAPALISNGLKISFDARTSNGGDFISLGFGSFTGTPSGGFSSGSPGFGAIYGYADMDWGYRAENDRAISFLADDTTNVSMLETYSIGNFNWYHVEVDLQFTDFDAGSTVTTRATVYDGQGNGGPVVSTISDSFTLSATDNFVFDFSVNENGSEVLFDNLVISTVPEASQILAFALVSSLCGIRRRRASAK